jgi:hypothetical protein
MNPYGYFAIIFLVASMLFLSIGALIEESDKKQEPVPLTDVYVIQTYEIADIENRLFDIERRLSEVEQ